MEPELFHFPDHFNEFRFQIPETELENSITGLPPNDANAYNRLDAKQHFEFEVSCGNFEPGQILEEIPYNPEVDVFASDSFLPPVMPYNDLRYGSVSPGCSSNSDCSFRSPEQLSWSPPVPFRTPQWTPATPSMTSQIVPGSYSPPDLCGDSRLPISSQDEFRSGIAAKQAKIDFLRRASANASYQFLLDELEDPKGLAKWGREPWRVVIKNTKAFAEKWAQGSYTSYSRSIKEEVNEGRIGSFRLLKRMTHAGNFMFLPGYNGNQIPDVPEEAYLLSMDQVAQLKRARKPQTPSFHPYHHSSVMEKNTPRTHYYTNKLPRQAFSKIQICDENEWRNSGYGLINYHNFANPLMMGDLCVSSPLLHQCYNQMLPMHYPQLPPPQSQFLPMGYGNDMTSEIWKETKQCDFSGQTQPPIDKGCNILDIAAEHCT